MAKLMSLSSQQPDRPVIQEIDMERLEVINDQPFSAYEGERFTQMVASIREHGILTPLIVVPIDETPGRYRVLAGRNRRNCGMAAGLPRAPCIVKEGLTMRRSGSI